MSESYEEAIEAALAELVERAYDEQRKTDKFFDERSAMMTQTAQRASEIIDTLSDEDQAVIDFYINETALIYAARMEYLYVQGAKDFVLLMKKLGVF